MQTSSILRTVAYRLKDSGAGVTRDLRRKRGVEWTGIMAPSYAPGWVYNRQKLWSAWRSDPEWHLGRGGFQRAGNRCARSWLWPFPCRPVGMALVPQN
ncbi:MAG: MobA/MobL family protein [Acetobacteraceae bacterium]